jgi:hypothetical protein
MQVDIKPDGTISVHSGTRGQVGRLHYALIREGASAIIQPTWERDSDTYFTDLKLPDEELTVLVCSPRNRRCVYIAIRHVARSMHCVVYRDMGSQVLRIKGSDAWDYKLINLIGLLVCKSRIWSRQTGIGPSLSIDLAGLGIV